VGDFDVYKHTQHTLCMVMINTPLLPCRSVGHVVRTTSFTSLKYKWIHGYNWRISEWSLHKVVAAW